MLYIGDVRAAHASSQFFKREIDAVRGVYSRQSGTYIYVYLMGGVVYILVYVWNTPSGATRDGHIAAVCDGSGLGGGFELMGVFGL